MSLYDRIIARPGGQRDLAKARLRYEALGALQRAFVMSGITQAELARKLGVRRSAVNGIVRGDGNVRINTLAECLFEMGFELNIELVEAGDPHREEVASHAPDEPERQPRLHHSSKTVIGRSPAYVVIVTSDDSFQEGTIGTGISETRMVF